MRNLKLLCLLSLSCILFIVSACSGNAGPATPLPLTQSFQSTDNGVALNYPAGWIAQDLLGQVTIANSQPALDALTPAPNQFQARLFATRLTAIQGLKADAAPRDVLQFFANTLSTSGVTFTTPTDLTIGTYAASRVEGAGTDGQAVVFAVNLNDGNYVFVSATAGQGEMSRFEPTLIAILASLTYTPPASAAPQSLVPETTPQQ
jgi:hypothetical protein